MGDSSWFDGARFGMFVHWGHCSQRGSELSWPMAGGIGALPFAADVPVTEYHATAATFDPYPGAANGWAALARRAGMRYAVLTTKHHDGFALWPTRKTDWSIGLTPYRGDVVGEFVDAMRDAGLRVGLYFSLADWHHPDYPALTDADKPYGSFRRSPPDAWARFVDVLFGQVEELLTHYGPIDLVWFDGGWERTAEEWRSADLERLIRNLQPGILINDRLPGARGDYETPEQFVPPLPPAGRWETCMTMNATWGYCPADTTYKPARQLVHSLCEVAGRGGNFLLNVSPMADGALPVEQVERLDAVGRWMAAHAEAVHDTTPGLEPWQFYGPTTRKGDRVFLHLLWRPYETVTVRGLPIRRVGDVRDMATGTELPFTTRAAVLDELLGGDPMGEVTITVPESVVDPLATVIELRVTPPGVSS